MDPSSNKWHIVTSLYPNILTQTYCVPPVHFNRIPYRRDTVPGTGHSVLVLHPASDAAPVHNVPPVQQRPVPPSQYSVWSQEPDPQTKPVRVQDNDIREDFSQNHVMLNMQELGSKYQEVMFILSRVNFGTYLNQPPYAAAAAQLPLPSDLSTGKTVYSDGETDFLLIHRRHGILIGELKSVGKNQAGLNQTQAEADAHVAKKVKQGVKQLNRVETLVRYLVSDVAPVRKTLFLPYVSTEQLQRVLENGQGELIQDVCQSLNATSVAEAVQLCCCSDQMSDPASYWDVTPETLSKLRIWWEHRMACNQVNELPEQVYQDIVARFVGPATAVTVPSYNGLRVEVRTHAEAVAELGWRLALLVLTLQQLDLMNRNPRRVCITGPPGTGKTVVLILQGLRWLLRGDNVHIVSSRYKSRGISRMIKEQLQMSLSVDPNRSGNVGTVVQHDYDFYNSMDEARRAITNLLSQVKNGRICVLVDEAFFESRYQEGPPHCLLVSELSRRVRDLHFWTACVEHTGIPSELQKEEFTVPLRCAPCILRELRPVVAREQGRVLSYCNDGVSSPGDGLDVIQLIHKGKAHTSRWPVDCVKCGLDIAAELRKLGVGTDGSGFANSPSLLKYRDVFVLTRSTTLKEEILDDEDNILQAASGVVQGLRSADMEVCVVAHEDLLYNRPRWLSDVGDMAAAVHDCITVAHYGAVPGLERRVVVILPGRMQGIEDNVSDEDLLQLDMLEAASRCTTQLILVNTPLACPATSERKKKGDDHHHVGGNDRSSKNRGQTAKGASGTTDVSWVKKKGFLL